MLTCGIVEDDQISAERLERMLREIDDTIKVLFKVRSCKELIRELKVHSPDVLFLDIHLLDDIVFNVLSELDYEPFVIFTTAYDEYAVKAFEEGAIDYILKPITRERVERALERVRKLRGLHESKQNLDVLRNLKLRTRLPIQVGEDILFVDTDEIIYAMADNKNVVLVTVRGKMTCKTALHTLEERLVEHGFLRVHKSYLISLRHISKVKKWFHGGYIVQMSNGDEIKVSKGYQRAFLETIGYKSQDF
ncbi:LytR/AlgR family response regulator transcription factor [Fervidobacterium thailandense]|uniref:Response regulator transcription factor n=1 Tax=Fervidobacterium thailandense TaxID=1008305 RepID=A0A1E3G361_9BACT|nr:LytTR family DNA-binding domain-containing protein [Fervidobacterium thailandense]ODN30736.1 hypothetical protein A4H02_04195 [Fervidobacterium thailandense]